MESFPEGTPAGNDSPTAVTQPRQTSSGPKALSAGLTDRRGFAVPRPRRLPISAIEATVAVLAFLGLWQLSGLFLAPIFVSTPSQVAQAFWRIAGGGLGSAFLASLEELAVGFVIACLLGVTVGLVMGRVRILDRALDPYVAFANAAPLIAVLPLIVIWFGLGRSARIVFVVAIGVWTMVVNTASGVKSVDRKYGDVGLAFGLSSGRALRSIYLPAAMPFIFAGARIALAQCVVGMLIGGQEIGDAGLGGMVETEAGYGQTDALIATVFCSTALALICFWLLRTAQRVFFPWITGLASSR